MIIALALFLLFNHAYSLPVLEINNNCSFPAPSGLSDVSEPTQNHRKALDILWSCYATTLSCTWAAVHPNMAFFEDNRFPLGSRIERRICLVLLALLMPEIIVAWSYAQMSSARQIKHDIDNGNFQKGKRLNPLLASSILVLIAYVGPSRWTITHSHFLQMGGFRLRCTEDVVKRSNLILKFHYKDNEGCVWVVPARAFMNLLEKKMIEFPRVNAETLMDRGKRDGFLKYFTILQLLWFSIQTFARVRNHMEVTLIEITTIALVTNSIFMYCFWLSKPFDASTPEYLCLVQGSDRYATLLESCPPGSASTPFPGAAPELDYTHSPPFPTHQEIDEHTGDTGDGLTSPELDPGHDCSGNPGRGSVTSALKRIFKDVRELVPDTVRQFYMAPSWRSSIAGPQSEQPLHEAVDENISHGQEQTT